MSKVKVRSILKIPLFTTHFIILCVIETIPTTTTKERDGQRVGCELSVGSDQAGGGAEDS